MKLVVSWKLWSAIVTAGGLWWGITALTPSNHKAVVSARETVSKLLNREQIAYEFEGNEQVGSFDPDKEDHVAPYLPRNPALAAPVSVVDGCFTVKPSAVHVTGEEHVPFKCFLLWTGTGYRCLDIRIKSWSFQRKLDEEDR